MVATVPIGGVDERAEDQGCREEPEPHERFRIYGQVASECLAAGCTGITVWGISDRSTWLDSFFGRSTKPLMWDEELEPKPAYFAVLAALRSEPPNPTSTTTTSTPEPDAVEGAGPVTPSPATLSPPDPPSRDRKTETRFAAAWLPPRR